MRAIALQRLISQQLAHSHLSNPTEVVRWLGAVQAQDYLGAKWSLGLRIESAHDRDIEVALNNGTIYRTWAMRGTLHFVAASDIHWMLALVAPRIIAANARRYRELELDQPTFARSNPILVEALTQSAPLNRTALMAILKQHGISTTGQRAPYLLQRASLDRLICQAATVKNDPTYQLLRVPGSDAALFDTTAALAELTRRYFQSRGPATVADFGWWSGLPIADVKRGMAALKPELVEETIDGQSYWRHRDTPTSDNPPSCAYLLPGFDEYLLSYKDRSASLDMPYMKTLTPANGMLNPTMVYDGRVIGTWRRTFQKKSVQVTLSPFAPLNLAQERAFAEALARYGAFIGLPVQLNA
ncbi:MAG: winged helix DNA-binding domain-containing protein [Aggregatilineales bacterium]